MIFNHVCKIKNIAMLTIALLTVTVHAQTVKIVSNLPTGSAPDTIARKLSDILSAKWKTPVLVDNRPGASGAIALEHYVTQPADGNTILMLDGGAWSTMPILYDKEDQFAKLEVLAPVYSNNWVVFTNSKVQTLSDLRTAIKNKPFYGSWGIGSAGHFCGLEVARVLGVTVTHVPYKEYGQWFADTVNGELAFSCGSTGSTEQYRNSSKINWLAITSERRDPKFADVPTGQEFFGSKFSVVRGQITFFTNKSAPLDRTNQMQIDIAQALQTPGMKESIEAIRGNPWTGTNAEFSQFISRSIATMRQLIVQNNIQVIK
jgi:tripartite-type tricarboxylate transporter receptor subunit TctC